MVPESPAITAPETGHRHRSRSHSHSGSHRSHRKHHSRRKKSLGEKFKEGAIQFFNKNRILLLTLFAALLVTCSLLWIFHQMEQETINQYSHQEAFE